MKFAITISTYYRRDGRSSFFLKRALESISNQTYQDYKIFLIGDRYENNEEFNEICESFKHPEKIYYKNLDVAEERDKYDNKLLIWKYGGVNSYNTAIEKSIEEGFKYICHLDHDDYWENNHLEVIKKAFEVTECSWLCTYATYREGGLPVIDCNEDYCQYYPKEGNVTHSSVCVNFDKVPIKYSKYDNQDPNVCKPADAIMWENVTNHCMENNLKCIFVNSLTCHTEPDGYFLNQ